MAMQPYLQPWPFHPETEVILWWVRSPRRLTDEKQWCVTACFETRDKQKHEIILPWGFLPLLRLGQCYANGFALAGEFIGKEVLLTLTGQPRLVLAIDALPADFMPPSRQFVGRDLCFLFEGDTPVVLPILEVVRSLLTPNRALAYGIFEPQFLEKVVTETHIRDSHLHLAFAREISPQALSKPVVGHITRLLYDESFRAAWDSVARQRITLANAHPDTAARPLTCALPDLEPIWRARVVTFGKVHLVLEILGVTPMKMMPFSSVHFTHPRMTAAPRRKGNRKQPSNHSSRSKPSEGTILSTKLKGPRAPREARELKVLSSPVFNLKETNIVRVRRLRDEAAIGTSSGGIGTIDRSTVKKPDAIVSVADDTSDGGRILVGEFKPVQVFEEGLHLRSLPLSCPSTSGLSFFATMLSYLGRGGPADLDISWCLRAFPNAKNAGQSSRFALVGSLTRQYALVRLRWPRTTAWFLEFGKPDNRVLSTLVFQPYVGAKEGIVALVEKLLWEALTADGNWQEVKLAEMRNANELGYDLAKHLSRMPDVWARQLYHKAAKLADGSPKYIVRS